VNLEGAAAHDTTTAGPVGAPGGVRRRLSYLPGLEGIRGFALVAELTAHLGLFVVTAAYRLLMPGALTVMSIFFVLSGFFITVMLLQDHDRFGRIRFWRFWRGRGRRLYPPLLLVLAAHWLIVLHYQRSIGLEWRDDLWALTNTMDYRYAVTGEPALDRAELVILWSIAVEVQFYLLWPFVVAGLVKYAKSLRKIVWTLAIIALGSTIVRTVEYRAWGDWLAVYFRFEGRIDAFAIGSILAFLWYRRKLPLATLRRLAWPCLLVFVASFWLVTLQTKSLYTWGFLAFNLAAFVLVGACLDRSFAITRFFANRFLTLAGRVAYSFYIIHIQVYMWVVLERRYLPMWQQVALALGGTLVFGTLGYLVAERPFVSVRHTRRVAVRPSPVGADP
jgi:peptidoglycan/LPS O-acetylase OafA/YrhL